MKEDERRRYFRVDDTAILSFKVLNDMEKDILVAQLNSNYLDALDNQRLYLSLEGDFQGRMTALQEKSPEIKALLGIVNKKMNVLAKVSHLEEESDSLMDKQPQAVNLSACGLAFENPAPLPEGNFLCVELLLLPDSRYLICIGKVVNCIPIGFGKGYKIGVEIDTIRQTDREWLIRHIMKRDAELLKMRRID